MQRINTAYCQHGRKSVLCDLHVHEYFFSTVHLVSLRLGMPEANGWWEDQAYQVFVQGQPPLALLMLSVLKQYPDYSK